MEEEEARGEGYLAEIRGGGRGARRKGRIRRKPGVKGWRVMLDRGPFLSRDGINNT